MSPEFVVVDVSGERLPGIPTPMLVSLGGGLAFSKGRIGTKPVEGEVWYAVADGYTAKPEDVRRVRIERWEDYEVTLLIRPVGERLSPEDSEPFEERFYVTAGDARRADGLAVEKAQKLIEQMFDGEAASDITIIRTLRSEDVITGRVR